MIIYNMIVYNINIILYYIIYYITSQQPRQARGAGTHTSGADAACAEEDKQKILDKKLSELHKKQQQQSG